MKKLLLLIPTLILAGMFFYGCQEEFVNQPEGGRLNLVTITQSGESSTPIFAGQNTEVGKVTLVDIDTNNDGLKDALQVKYEIILAPWVITDIHFALGTESIDIPQTKKGNLIPGQFGYKFENLGGLTDYTFTIPFTAFGFDCDPDDVLYAAAHCVVGIPGAGGYTQTETGWGSGDPTNGNNWAMIFSFNINCDVNNPPPPGQTTETAFAGGCEDFSTCFGVIDPTISRWGWSNELTNGAGTYYFDLYAGAAQCDYENKGTLVGEVVVEYDGISTAVVTFTTCGDYTLDETHLYIGNTPLYIKDSENTVAPGQFPYNDLVVIVNDKTHEYTVEGLLAGDIYVVAHASVLGPLEGVWIDCGTPAGCSFEPPCTPEVSWTDFYSTLTPTSPATTTIFPVTSGAIPSFNFTLCDGKTVNIQVTNISSPKFLMWQPIASTFTWLDNHTVFGDFNGTGLDMITTRCLAADGNAVIAPNSYKVTWDFGTNPLDHTNFFTVGQFWRPTNVLTMTAYAADGVTVVSNTTFDYQMLRAGQTGIPFTESLTWDPTLGKLYKGVPGDEGPNTGWGFFSIPQGTTIGKIVFEVNDTRSSTADALQWGIGCFGCN